jgi:hypothetical protein
MDIIDYRDLPPQEGFDLRVLLVPDLDAGPPEKETEAADLEYCSAWRNDQWSYVGCVVQASRVGVVLGESSVWSMEYGSYHTDAGELISMDPLIDQPGFGTLNPETGEVEREVTFANGYGSGLITEAVENAKATVAIINQVDAPCATPAQS